MPPSATLNLSVAAPRSRNSTLFDQKSLQVSKHVYMDQTHEDQMNISAKLTTRALLFGYYLLAVDRVFYVDALDTIKVGQPLDLTSPKQTRNLVFNENFWCPTPGTPFLTRADGVTSDLHLADLVSRYRLAFVLALPGLGASRGRRDAKPCRP